MTAKQLKEEIANKLKLDRHLKPAVVGGEGYEALIIREGIVIGKIELGTVEEIEGA